MNAELEHYVRFFTTLHQAIGDQLADLPPLPEEGGPGKRSAPAQGASTWSVASGATRASSSWRPVIGVL